MKRSFIVAGLFSLATFQAGWAQSGLFSQSELKQIKKISTSSSKEGCMKFVATYSKPLKNKPTAVLDVDTSNLFAGLISLAMEVITISPEKYEVEVKDTKVCNTLKENHSSVAVSLADAVGNDGKQVLPSGEIFEVLPR